MPTHTVRNKEAEQVNKLALQLKHELQGFLLAPLISMPSVGFVDIPLFGLRFRLSNVEPPDTESYKVLEITSVEKLDAEALFVELASRGYMGWLRHRTKDSHIYYTILQHKDRWKRLLEFALEKALAEGQSPYRINHLKELLAQPFQQIFHHDPTIFDWLVV